MDIVSPNAHEILPGLWLGNRHAASDGKWLQENGITVVFNCTKDLPFCPIIKSQYRLHVDDNLQREEIVNMTLWSHEAVYLVLKEYNRGKKILIHCAAGMQRSAALMAMVLISLKGVAWQQAISFIQSIRPIAFRPSANFRDSIIAYYESYQKEIAPRISLR